MVHKIIIEEIQTTDVANKISNNKYTKILKVFNIIIFKHSYTLKHEVKTKESTVGFKAN